MEQISTVTLLPASLCELDEKKHDNCEQKRQHHEQQTYFDGKPHSQGPTTIRMFQNRLKRTATTALPNDHYIIEDIVSSEVPSQTAKSIKLVLLNTYDSSHSK